MLHECLRAKSGKELNHRTGAVKDSEAGVSRYFAETIYLHLTRYTETFHDFDWHKVCQFIPNGAENWNRVQKFEI